jgi:hypothetical protein
MAALAASSLLTALAGAILSLAYLCATARQPGIDWQIFAVVALLLLTVVGLVATAAIPFLLP